MLTVKSFMPLALVVVLVVGGLTVIPGQASAVTLNVFTDPHVAATSAAAAPCGISECTRSTPVVAPC